jgi:hypothetical protein
MNTTKDVLKHTLALWVSVLLSYPVYAAEAHRNPTAVLNALADRIYVIGETTGKVADMIAAEEKAADDIRRYIASGSTDELLPTEKGKQTPLAAAAYMGYPNVVAALLTSDLVRARINDADEMGLTPWIAANLSMRQVLWVCNPAVFDIPYKFVPVFVTQPFYSSNPTSPYRKTRDVLERAGAHPDITKAKEIWLTNCKGQSNEEKLKVRASADLQKTIQELGAANLSAQLIKLRQRALDAKKKQ